MNWRVGRLDGGTVVIETDEQFQEAHHRHVVHDMRQVLSLSLALYLSFSLSLPFFFSLSPSLPFSLYLCISLSLFLSLVQREREVDNEEVSLSCRFAGGATPD